MDKEIAADFYTPLGKLVVNFARLDDAMAMSIFTLMNQDPVGSPAPGVTTLGGPMPQLTYRVLISGIPSMQRAEILTKLAKMAFPDKKAEIGDLFSELKKAIEERNIYMHYVWHSAGQIGFTPRGRATVRERTLEEVDDFANEVNKLAHRVQGLHGKLLGLDKDPSL